MNAQDQQRIAGQVRAMQIIHFSLILGVLAPLAIVVYVVQNSPPVRPEGALPLVSLLGLIMMLSCAPIGFIALRTMAQQNLRRLATRTSADAQNLTSRAGPGELSPEARAFLGSETGQLLAARMTGGIVRAAMIEGSTYTGVFGYLIEGHWLGLAVAAAGIVLQVLTFPTHGGVGAWLEQQRQALAAQKRGG